ncbi:stage V sporulation protein AD [Mycoplasmatota bacterium WC44]
MAKIGKDSVQFKNVFISDTATVVGPLENEGPLANFFDFAFDDMYCEESSWEKAEQRLVKDAITLVMNKGFKNEKDIDYIIAGDLINQDVISNYVMREFDIPLFGIYGACSTSVEGLILASIIIEGASGSDVIVSTSSHNSTAERQFRNPTEYGGQKPDTATYTVTGAGACLLTNKQTVIKVESATVGKVIDAKQKDANDMGSAMAPAASETIRQHLEDLNREPSYYDMIVTGDLSNVGKPILIDILKDNEIDISMNHSDCGLMIYDIDKQPVFAGGSGCGCCAVVTFGYLISLMKNKVLNRILVVATGALMNPIMMFQKETIPSIAHAISLERYDIS